MLAVAGVSGDLLVSRDAHKSVTAGLIFSGLQHRWIRPRWDPELHLAHTPSPEQVQDMWQRYPDAAATLVVSPTRTARARTFRASPRPVIHGGSR